MELYGFLLKYRSKKPCSIAGPCHSSLPEGSKICYEEEISVGLIEHHEEGEYIFDFFIEEPMSFKELKKHAKKMDYHKILEHKSMKIVDIEVKGKEYIELMVEMYDHINNALDNMIERNERLGEAS